MKPSLLLGAGIREKAGTTMDKKSLTEADIRTKFITPALAGKWDVDHLLPEYEKLLAQIDETRGKLKAQLMEALRRRERNPLNRCGMATSSHLWPSLFRSTTKPRHLPPRPSIFLSACGTGA
jgi:hypothetical protein